MSQPSAEAANEIRLDHTVSSGQHRLRRWWLGLSFTGGWKLASVAALLLALLVHAERPKRSAGFAVRGDVLRSWIVRLGRELVVALALLVGPSSATTLPTSLPTSTTSIFYSNNAYTGTIPTQWGLLTKVTTLWLNVNQLSGSMPSELGQMTKMDIQFYLNDNTLSGSVPSELGQMTEMKGYFWLNDNALSGSLPSELAQMAAMTEYFYLYNNALCDDLPTEVQALSSQVTSFWQVVTGNYLGTLCCEALPNSFGCDPTLLPTPQPTVSLPPTRGSEPPTPQPTLPPTPLPTHLPTPLPTHLPTPLPSALPTQLPTPLPSALPTRLPSPLPSQLPTRLPSPLPTPLPSPLPTPAPTRFCQRGEFLDGGACQPCEVGKFRNDSLPPAVCTLCAAGTYRGYSSDPRDALACYDCPTGRLSAADRSECTECSPGEYALNDTSCESCEAGKYAPVALADSCLSCAAGSATGVNLAATSCESCDAGLYSVAESVNCSTCPVGTFSTSRSEACTDCPAGFFSEVEGASTCTACAAGFFVVDQGASNCSGCGVGTFQSASGQSECDDCEAGKFADASGSSSCSSCDAGTFSNTSASSCANCPAGTSSGSGVSSCDDCEAGKFAGATGSSSCSSCDAGTFSGTAASACANCSAGTYSDARATSCKSCFAGSFSGLAGSSSCTSCDAGTYSGTSASSCADCPAGTSSGSGASSCQDCPAGFVSGTVGSSSCTACAAGHASNDTGATNCSACSTGTHQSASGQSECDDCEAGKFADATGSSSCSSCDVGTFSGAGASSCADCPVGTASGSGATSCNDCEAGKFAEAAGASTCLKCSSEVGAAFTSTNGASSCDRCIEGSYMNDDGECVACPDGVDCGQPGCKLAGLEIEAGFFRFTSASTEVYECDFPNNCRGGNLTGDSNAQCTKGATGPLCTNCEVGFFFDSFAQACVECNVDTGSLVGPAVVFGLLLVVGAVVFLLREQLGSWGLRFYADHGPRIDDAMELMTAVVVTMQIIVLLQSNHLQLGGEEMQSPYERFLEAFSFLALDIVRGVPSGCVAPVGHFDLVVVWTLLPVAIFCAGAVALRKAIPEDRTAWLGYFVFGLFLVLPTMSTTICGTFRCSEYDGGDFRFLAMDHEVDCTSSEYRGMVAFAVLACLVYPVGVPLGLLVWLAKFRHRLDPPDLEERRATAQRAADEHLVKDCAVAVFALRHRPRFWFFEVYSMLRRLLLTSVPLVFDSVESMLLFILFVAILTTVVEREAQAELNPFLGSFVYVCHWQVVLVIIGMFAADAEMTQGAGTATIGSVLLLCNLAIIGVVFVDKRAMVHRDKRLGALQKRLSTQSRRQPRKQRCPPSDEAGFSASSGAESFAGFNPLHDAPGGDVELREFPKNESEAELEEVAAGEDVELRASPTRVAEAEAEEEADTCEVSVEVDAETVVFDVVGGKMVA